MWIIKLACAMNSVRCEMDVNYGKIRVMSALE